MLVLGMHRSGTSAVTGVLSRLGAVEPKTLLEPNAGNPKGYSESRVVIEFNDRLLKFLGGAWFAVNTFDETSMSSSACEPFKQEALTIIQSEFGDSDFISLKDPRICRLAGFWLERLAEAGYETKVVIPYRNPLEVAASLRKRNGFSLTYSLLLWLRYVLDAEAATRDYPRSFIGYDEMLADWELAIERISRELNVSWPRRPADAHNEIQQFLSAELRHNTSSEPELFSQNNVQGLIKDAYLILVDLARGDKKRGQLFEKLDQIRARFGEICEITGPALAFGREVEDRLVRQEKEMRECLSHVAALQRESKNNTILHKQVHEDFKKNLASLEQSFRDRASETEKLFRMLGERDEEIKRLVKRASIMRNSLSWRLTRPLRILSGWLRGKS